MILYSLLRDFIGSAVLTIDNGYTGIRFLRGKKGKVKHEGISGDGKDGDKEERQKKKKRIMKLVYCSLSFTISNF